MSGGGCAGRKKGRERKALTCGPGSPEREARLARGAALSEGERGRARLAGPASCAARAWAGWATDGVEGRSRLGPGKKKALAHGLLGCAKEVGRSGGLWAELGLSWKLGWAAVGFGVCWVLVCFFSISKSISYFYSSSSKTI
jgi:hypothetical protein